MKFTDKIMMKVRKSMQPRGYVLVADAGDCALELPEGETIGECQRPLRASTAQGERIALAHSETVPAGTTQEFDVAILKDDLVPVVLEWFAYGEFHGTGQWRNSGKGRFVCRVTDEDGKVLHDTL